MGTSRFLFLTVVFLAACAPLASDPEAGFEEGAPFDDNGEFDATGDKALGYEAPDDVPELVSPEVRVSIDGLTTHLFDRATGFSRVYEVGLGRLGSDGRSFSPIGHFTTSPDASESWWYMDARWSPDYYEGLPFVRFSKKNSRGNYTYAFHGRVTNPLQVGYVSGGCTRMRPADIIEFYWILKAHPGVHIAIQQEIETDANGEPLQVGVEAALYDPGAEIPYGPSVGPHVTGFIGDPCETDAQCGGYPDTSGSYCHRSGFCTEACDGYCPDLLGKPSTFCVSDPASDGGACVPVANEVTGTCTVVPGSVPERAPRYIGTSGASASTQAACVPVEPEQP